MYDFEKNLNITVSEEWVGIRTMKRKYIAEIIHSDLHEHKIITSYDKEVLKNKMNEYVEKLREKFSIFIQKRLITQKSETAEERTITAKRKINQIENILIHTLSVNDAVNWNDLKDKSKYKIGNPKNVINNEIGKIEKPKTVNLIELPSEPQSVDFEPNFNFLDLLFPTLKKKKIEKFKDEFEYQHKIWESEINRIKNINDLEKKRYQISLNEYNSKVAEIKKKYDELESIWIDNKNEFYRIQETFNKNIDELKEKYENGIDFAVEEYCEIVLNNSVYPESFPKTFKLVYNDTNKQLVIDYDLPPIDVLPRLKEVKLVSKEIKEYFLTENQLNELFDLTLYRICLRTIHEIFEADTFNNIDSICFNGWVNALNLAKGYRINSCIMSIQVMKSEFLDINLKDIDVKACFKSLKGVGSSKLSGINPIQPIITINKDDKRIVEHYNVVDGLDSSTNLAMMDWEDFENLIREVFEREFKSNGGEVKVTQASRDGGVDAIAFDPDPIRGGKIVIQAKRYTNTVGVSAVRDLFGTLNHEGATKGILVTTADYGPDAYEFAKGKPITLLNGSNLLYLLQKHGYNARIDIKEAKQINI